MTKYVHLAKLHFQTQLEYRAELLIGRIQNIIGLLTVFLIWQAVYTAPSQTIVGYTSADMYSYVLFGYIFFTLTESTWIANLQGNIASGNLNQFLIKPINIITYTLSEDFAEKIFNVFFTILELGILYFIFRPELNLQVTPINLLALILMIPLVFILNMLVSLSLSFSTFWWYQNGGWGQRFLADLIINFFSGKYFPLEFLPFLISSTLIFLPTSLFYFIPMQIFLNRVSTQQLPIYFGLLFFWILVFWLLDRHLWRKGLKTYGAFGS